MLAEGLVPGAIGLAWLGQAGFAVKYGPHVLLIDPYLSNSLAEKYRGTPFPHLRMAEPPITPAELRNVDFVFCTHRHGDHMDPGTLPVVADNNPNCRFIVPRAERDSAVAMGLIKEQIIAIDAGDSALLTPDVKATAVPAAHETFQQNEVGEHHYLGYLLQFGSMTLYHSGDCVPYDGLAEQLRRANVNLALLPVNGRDAYRRSHGIPGNMTFDEAELLCRSAGIPWLMPHHFGTFDFNTIALPELEQKIKHVSADVSIILPTICQWLEIFRGVKSSFEPPL
jgi:L-ascorbate metabolism protein UlaG (beta-lactamase superfamily)